MRRKTNLARASLAMLVTAAMLALGASAASAQQSFKSAEEGAEALAKAVRSGDRRQILSVLGLGAFDIVSSGDDVADEDTRRRFIEAYDAGHRFTTDEEGRAVMLVGSDGYPFPIPLVEKNEIWRYDVDAGRLEILYRRIGRNELNAMQTCYAYVDAQIEYSEKDRTGQGAGTYAQRFVSRPGKKDGLYWPATAQDGEVSPLGVFAALASAEGYRLTRQRTPYHGYYYRILTSQGPNAPGGTADYVVRGRMMGGFAMVAYPAEYGNSGVMTFVVNHKGQIYEKDLGPRTGRYAERMWSFNPDQTWRKVEVTSPHWLAR